MPDRYDLGSITCPSGILVVLDLGYLWLWSGSSLPQPQFDGSESPETRAAIESMRDYRIVGPDAARTGEIANMIAISSFRFMYDLPEKGRDGFLAKIDGVATAHGLDAHVEPEPARVPHRARAQRAADLGGGEFFIWGGPMTVALGGVPNRLLFVTVDRRDFGGNVGSRWGELTVRVAPGDRQASQLVGYFGVDYGMALLGDADALSDRRIEAELRRQIGLSPIGVGACQIGGATVLGMNNSWGDGIFPVFADRGASGELISVRVVLGDEDRRQLAEKVWAQAQLR